CMAGFMLCFSYKKNINTLSPIMLFSLKTILSKGLPTIIWTLAFFLFTCSLVTTIHKSSMFSTITCVHLQIYWIGVYELNSSQMLALRCEKYNGTFDRVFERYQQRLRKA